MNTQENKTPSKGTIEKWIVLFLAKDKYFLNTFFCFIINNQIIIDML